MQRHMKSRNLKRGPLGVVDLNVAVINPYVGGLGDLMSQVEPAIAMAVQDGNGQRYETT